MAGKLSETSDSVTYGRNESDKGAGILLIVLFGIPALIGFSMAISPNTFGADVVNIRGDGVGLFVIFGAIASLGATYFVQLKVELFPASKTYKYSNGSKVRTGSYEDIRALQFTQGRTRGGSSTFKIRLTWNNDLKEIPIYFSYDQDEARKELEEISARTGLVGKSE